MNINLKELEVSSEEIDYTALTAVALTEFVENIHHRFLKSALPETLGMLEMVESIHGDEYEELEELVEEYTIMKVLIEEHMKIEEEELFVHIKEYGYHPGKEVYEKAMVLVEQFLIEHDKVNQHLLSIRKIANDFELDEAACPNHVLAYNQLVNIEEDLQKHIYLENDVLFEQLRKGIYTEVKMN